MAGRMATLYVLIMIAHQGMYSQTLLPQDTMSVGKPMGGDDSPYRFRATQLIVPTALIGVGLIGLESQWIIYQNHEIRNELQENIDRRLTIDDFTQYAPATAVYGLNLCGVKGHHDALRQTLILGTAYALMGISVNTIKHTSSVRRPDESTTNSFPSGHTATAFVGAEVLRREYWDVSPWIGVAGYAVAAGTGFFRIYNNRHWLTDVLAGAGIGILSADIAYWLYPTLSKALLPKSSKHSLHLSPCITPEEKGLTARIVF